MSLNTILLTAIGLFLSFQRVYSAECFSSNTTYALCRVDEPIPVVVSNTFLGNELATECHGHFITDSFNESCTTDHDHEHDHDEEDRPSKSKSYGYGFLAVFIICCLSLVGILAVPFINKSVFPYVLVSFTALAVGTLFGDSMFHLIPFAFGLHSHNEDPNSDGHDHRAVEHDHEETVPLYQWRALVSVMVLYSFYLLEVLLHSIGHRFVNKNGSSQYHGHSHGISIDSSSKNSFNRNSVGVIRPGNGVELEQFSNNQNGKVVSESPESRSESENTNENHSIPMSAGWMVIIGDAIHNFADGLAIGAAFSQNLLIGLTTTIAVGCHELPHELGDYAVLLQAGFSRCRALMWNFVSSLTALIGLFIGVAVSTNDNARQWIFAVTVGMFLYIALVDLLPTLLPHGNIEWKRFVCVNVGFLLGILIMYLLAIYEEKLIDSVGGH